MYHLQTEVSGFPLQICILELVLLIFWITIGQQSPNSDFPGTSLKTMVWNYHALGSKNIHFLTNTPTFILMR